MAKPIEIIDQAARDAARSSEVLAFAIEGLLERMVIDDPSPRGIASFNSGVETVLRTGRDLIMARLSAGQDALKAHLSDSERAQFEQHDARDELYGDAATAIWGAFQQIRIAYIKRLRELITVRQQSGKVLSAKVMTRAGHKWKLADFVYLTVRQALIDRYNETKIGFMAQNQVERFTLDTDKEDLINASFAVKDYPAVAAKYFHPRTNSLVGDPHVSS